jgi:hypothetical protein
MWGNSASLERRESDIMNLKYKQAVGRAWIEAKTLEEFRVLCAKYAKTTDSGFNGCPYIQGFIKAFNLTIAA